MGMKMRRVRVRMRLRRMAMNRGACMKHRDWYLCNIGFCLLSKGYHITSKKITSCYTIDY